MGMLGGDGIFVVLRQKRAQMKVYKTLFLTVTMAFFIVTDADFNCRKATKTLSQRPKMLSQNAIIRHLLQFCWIFCGTYHNSTETL